MKTKFSHRISAMLMAILMFTSSVGFSMDMHFCGNEIKSFSFFGKAEPCEMMQPKVEKSEEKVKEHACCHSSEKKEVVKLECGHEEMKGICCHNETMTMLSGGELETPEVSIPEFQQALIAIIVFLPSFKIFETVNKVSDYAFYNPPPLIKDVSILNQVFRI
jgi:hypothetical protein